MPGKVKGRMSRTQDLRVAAKEESYAVREDPDRPQVDRSHYGRDYDQKGRLSSYWHQVDETLRFAPRSVLEVGIGTGFTSTALHREGVRVITVDVEPTLHPNVIGSIRALPIRSKGIDVALCCQVLEHLPFTEFAGALGELMRVASKGIVLSLPDRERHIRFCIATGGRQFFWGPFDVPRAPQRRPTGIHEQHCWEIGCRDMNLARVRAAIQEATGKAPRTYRVFEFPYHRFFILDL
jgi:hypothetical protein